jgi:spore coat protein SA
VKVLMVVTEKLPVPPVRGGAIQTYVAAVAGQLGRSHDLTILGVTDPSLPDRETVNGVNYVRVPGGDLETYLDNVTEYLRTRTFDLIHIFNRPRAVLPIRAVAMEARLVLSMHNDMFETFKIDPEEAAAAIEQLERIVTVSDYVGRRVAQLYPQAADKLRTIYSGVDLKRFAWSSSGEAKSVRNSLRRKLGLDGKKVILFVGRLSPKKGADVLVRAMPLIARKHPDAALVLVGSKWYGEDKVSDYVAYVRALAARAPVPVVTTGYVPADEVHQWFWAGDIFVCASLWEEPLARVHYEAMAAGLPIITTNRGGNPEVVEGMGNGLVVDRPEDPAAMAAAISTLLADSGKRNSMGSTGRALAEERYGWSRVAADILSVWQ